MIWINGTIVPDQAVQVSALDRTFEHGLGLFETFRTWNGHCPLLDRHLDRMERSARVLALPLDPGQLPDSRAVLELIAANRAHLEPGRDVRLRLTLSGGLATTPPSGSVLWMSVSPLPPPLAGPGAVITQITERAGDDLLTRHKTLNYWRKRIAHAQALEGGSDDALCVSCEGLILETTRSNLFLIEGRRLCTPGLEGALLPGVMRRLVLERAATLGFEIEEGPLPLRRIDSAGEAFLTSSVRGMLPIVRLMNAELPAPGLVTRQLWDDLLTWLESGGTPR
jgi:branched-subunit amino acid aminotransferase/4-amino-4-deoxychorismate lyase